MAKVTKDFHKGYVTALNHVHQLIAAHVAALQNGAQPQTENLPMPANAAGTANAGPLASMPPPPGPATAMSMKPSPAFPYGRPPG